MKKSGPVLIAILLCITSALLFLNLMPDKRPGIRTAIPTPAKQNVPTAQAAPKIPDQQNAAPQEFLVAEGHYVLANARVVEGIVQTFSKAKLITDGGVTLTCDKLVATIMKNEAVIVAEGHVLFEQNSGEQWNKVTADRVFYNSETKRFDFKGNIQSGVYYALVLGPQGKVYYSSTLREEFIFVKPEEKKFLAQQIFAVHGLEKMNIVEKYYFALAKLEPHLVWHKYFSPPSSKNAVPFKYEIEQENQIRHLIEAYPNRVESDSIWCEAHYGDPWIWPKKYQLKFEEGKHPECFWTLDNPGHADVVSAMKILQSINYDNVYPNTYFNARGWIRALERNNTVITFDVPAAYSAGKKAPVVIDVRGANQVTLKLYRVKSPEKLAPVFQNIGEEFLFVDYNLAYFGDRLCINKDWTAKSASSGYYNGRMSSDHLIKTEKDLPVELGEENIVKTWTTDVASLPFIDIERDLYEEYYSTRYNREYDLDDDDYSYNKFGGDNSPRAYKYYLRRGLPSSWICNRVIEIPGELIKDDGAYVLVAEANGQRAHAPLFVNPLDMTIGRCEDGVFVEVGDGLKPVTNAPVFLSGNLYGQLNLPKIKKSDQPEGPEPCALTNQDGVCFASRRVTSSTAILACQDGRYAIGGFGPLYNGLRKGIFDGRAREYWYGYAAKQIRELREVLIYRDSFAVAAYTDRPVYRPGQKVNFKVIVRKLIEKEREGKETYFRQSDFERNRTFELPRLDSDCRYEVSDAKNRVIQRGSLKLNNFGTGVGEFTLNEESALGAHSLALEVDYVRRVVPGFFKVDCYRRPNIKLSIEGLPAVIKDGEIPEFKISASYFFGKPLDGKEVEIRVLNAQLGGAEVYKTTVALDKSGQAVSSLKTSLCAGKYILSASVKDDSNQTADCSREFALAKTDEDFVNEITSIGKYIPCHKSVRIKSDKPIRAEYAGEDAEDKFVKRALVFHPLNGAVDLCFENPGWYSVDFGNTKKYVYAYGGYELFPNDIENHRLQKIGTEHQDWINLSKYTGERHDTNINLRNLHNNLYALFDQQTVQVNEKLPVLVFCPYKKARLLFTIEGQTIYDYYLTEIESTDSFYHLIEIPINKRWAPNFYLSARVIAGEKDTIPRLSHRARLLAKRQAEHYKEDEYDDPRWCRIDVYDPAPVKSAEKLRVNIQTDKKEYRPGDNVSVQISVTDSNREPAYAEVSLAAVDASIYQFGADRIGSLAADFEKPTFERRFRAKGWRVFNPQTRAIAFIDPSAKQELQIKCLQEAMLCQEMAQAKSCMKLAKDSISNDIEKAPLLPPGELPATVLFITDIRKDFRETAAWIPQLTTDRNGFAEASFKLPDNLTEYRLTAVGLTQKTEIGTGRASIVANKPVSAQMFLPRYFIKKDKLLVSGLIHNDTDKEQNLIFRWEVEDASVAIPDEHAKEWRLETQESKRTVTGSITIGAKKSEKVPIWFEASETGSVKVSFMAANEQFNDAMTDVRMVYPLGREKEFLAGGTFQKTTPINLPDGFYPGEIYIALNRGDASQALDGVEYLIEFPYGCVEQTMSRFLPAVMVKQAAKEAAVTLSPQLNEKIPAVLAKGLERLYKFQHKDGGWGWWEYDQTNNMMTAYVVYGLSQCKKAGTPVDNAVLRNGTDYLSSIIRQAGMDDDTKAYCLYALSSANGQYTYDLDLFLKTARDKALSYNSLCYLALACFETGKIGVGREFLDRIKSQKAPDALSLALKVKLMILYREPSKDIKSVASELILRKRGSYWGDTKTTAATVEAFALVLQSDKGGDIPKKVTVKYNGKVVGEIVDPKLLETTHYSFRFSALGKTPGGTIEVSTDTVDHIGYSVTSKGFEALDNYTGLNKGIGLTRTYSKVDGQPLTTIKPGDIIAVTLSFAPNNRCYYLILEDFKPAGFEYVDNAIYENLPAQTSNVEFRDNKLCVFFGWANPRSLPVKYYLRAENPGVSHATPAYMYDMYHSEYRGESATAKLEVK